MKLIQRYYKGSNNWFDNCFIVGNIYHFFPDNTIIINDHVYYNVRDKNKKIRKIRKKQVSNCFETLRQKRIRIIEEI